MRRGCISLLQASHVRRHRAFATTYLHVKWIGPEVLNALALDFPRSHFLVKFWALMRAAAEYMLEEYRAAQLSSMQLTAEDLMRRLNGDDPDHVLGAARVMGKASESGENLYTLRHNTLTARVLEALQGRLLITKAKRPDGTSRFKVTEPGAEAHSFKGFRPPVAHTADGGADEEEEDEEENAADPGLESLEV